MELALLAFRERRSDKRCEFEYVRAGARGPGNCAPRRSAMRPRTPTGHALARDTGAGDEIRGDDWFDVLLDLRFEVRFEV